MSSWSALHVGQNQTDQILSMFIIYIISIHKEPSLMEGVTITITNQSLSSVAKHTPTTVHPKPVIHYLSCHTMVKLIHALTHTHECTWSHRTGGRQSDPHPSLLINSIPQETALSLGQEDPTTLDPISATRIKIKQRSTI